MNIIWNGLVGLDTISVKRIADANSRAMALSSGEIDFTNTYDEIGSNTMWFLYDSNGMRVGFIYLG